MLARRLQQRGKTASNKESVTTIKPEAHKSKNKLFSVILNEEETNFSSDKNGNANLDSRDSPFVEDSNTF